MHAPKLFETLFSIGHFRYIASRAERRRFACNSVWAIYPGHIPSSAYRYWDVGLMCVNAHWSVGHHEPCLHVSMSNYPEGNACSEAVRDVVLNDPAAWVGRCRLTL